MKNLYWRPKKVSRWAIALIAVLSLAAMAVVEHLPLLRLEPQQERKRAATELARRGMEMIKQERLRRGHTIEPRFDPSQSGLIGESMSLVTSVPGNLRAKQTSVNPNFAAAVVDMLVKSGVQPGDLVAVGCSGSFPALNLSVYAALETMQVKPIVVLSATASQFGANSPDFMWVDMERFLAEQGLLKIRAQAASLGGYEDRGLGMSEGARELAESALRRNHVRLLDSETLEEGIEQRMAIYRDAAEGSPIKAYINVGGGAASTGRSEGKKRYRPGLNMKAPPTATEIDSVMTRFAKSGAPIIHLVEVNQLAEELGLADAPHVMPATGQGKMYSSRVYNRFLAGFLLLAISLSLRVFVLGDGAQRLRRLWPAADAKESSALERAPETLELMV